MPEINMPRLSDTMQEGTITRWLKKPGDTIKKGDIIAEVETDKANMEVESYDNGILEQILVQEGETAPIGQIIAMIGTGASKSSATATSPARKPAPETLNPVTLPAVVSVSEPETTSKLKASPLARRMAEEHAIDLHQLQGTGPGGRIVRDDIEEYLEQRDTTSTPATPAAIATPIIARPGPVANDEVIALTSMQKTIARRLTESKQQVPHFYIGNEIDMTDALALRKMLNDSAREGGSKISVNDLIVKACALALEHFPEVNRSWQEAQFIHHTQINIGIAVDIPGGLVVPVIKEANIKGVRVLARESKALAEKARAGKLTADELQGSTFSISNLGMMDVSDFIAVINPPEAAIMAVASVRKTFVPIASQPIIRDMMHVTISADHRVLYGATAARFLHEVKSLLENPYELLG